MGPEQSSDSTETNSHWLSFMAGDPATRALEMSVLKWGLAWGLVMGLAINSVRRDWISGPLIWVLPVLAVTLSLLVIYRYYLFLMSSDELTRKIQQDAIAVAFAFTWLLVSALETFEPMGAPQLEDNQVLALMLLAWGVGQIWGRWKYR